MDIFGYEYHEGERQIQDAGGVHHAADLLAEMVVPAISAGAQAFLGSVDVVALAGIDRRGRCWATLLGGLSGSVIATSTAVALGAPGGSDPLGELAPGDQVGMVAIDMPARQRLRVNGIVIAASATCLTVEVREAYGNCRKYIDTERMIGPTASAESLERSSLSREDAVLVASTTTFFIGSAHPDRGADCSHRGGPAGFVQVTSPTSLSFPDYPGNNMYNTLGNLLVNPSVGLVIPDPDGRHLQITGTATLQIGEPNEHTRTGRAVSVEIDEIRRPITDTPVRPL
ncbi:MAG: pyridoxamine 5'-phosphate oxidase family protein [Actinomycetota bacterium]|nr:pyridoxamine 5'-phosphate oxidase family protein [Actinomycetota bacterium]